MKIIYISSVSFADCDFPLVRQLKMSGHDVYYFMDLPFYAKKANIININEQIEEEGIIDAYRYKELRAFKEYLGIEQFYVVNRLKNRMMLLRELMDYLKLRRLMKKINPDVVHFVGDINIGNFPAALGFRHRTVVTVHDPFPHTGEKSLRGDLSRWLTINFAKKFILLNDSLAGRFKDHWKLDSKRIGLSKLGPYECTKLFLPKKDTNTIKNNNVLFYGRISPYKGLEYLCEAMTIVRKHVRDATLTIAGGGRLYFDFSNYEKLNYIKLINRYVDNTELAVLLKNSAVVVCPYTDATQSGVVLTSFAMERPVIASNVGGMAEYITDGKTGILIEPKKTEALAQAIISLLSDESRKERFQVNIRDRNNSMEGGWCGIVKDYIGFYESMI